MAVAMAAAVHPEDASTVLLPLQVPQPDPALAGAVWRVRALWWRGVVCRQQQMPRH